jgi:sec-independent protein translocase protein TatC
MPFLKHLDELRKRIFVLIAVLIVAIVCVGTVVAYFFTDPIYRFVLAPVWPVLKGGQPVALGVLDPMMVRFGLSFWSAIVVCSPLIIWQLMGFLLPALKPAERKWIVPTFVAMVVLFFAGVALCYTIILPASFQWLADQTGTIMKFMPQAGDMLSVVEFFLLGFGVAFQVPVIVFYLVYFGVIPYRVLRENWRFVYVGITIAASMITPDWSPVSMGALAIAMVILYELSLLACRVFLSRRIKAQNAPPAEDEDEDADLAKA